MALPTPFALARFGLGPRQGTLADVGGDARGFLEAELTRRDVAIATDTPLPSSIDGFKAHAAYSQEKKAKKRASADTGSMTPSMQVSAQSSKKRAVWAELLRDEIAARLDHVIEGDATKAGYVERLVWFWANHFAVSARKSGRVTAMIGPYEREAIRPHVLGKFSDMLVAVEKHPAMLLYLDNAASVGPNSPAGRNRRRGLNENLAREILELHTLGAQGGYTQADVTSLSALITGWTVAGDQGRQGEPGSFAFSEGRHEPGVHKVLGVAYESDYDESGGVKALRDIARRPATANHLALKLARHFVSEAPPDALVDRLAKKFQDTDGDLYEVSRALLVSPEAWVEERAKFRSPREFVVAAMRLPGGFDEDRRPNAFMSYLATLGEPVWSPPAPNGFPDNFDSWASPEGLGKRLDVAARLSSRVQTDHREILEAAFGEMELSEELRRTLKGAESRQQAASILLMSPDFQRR